MPPIWLCSGLALPLAGETRWKHVFRAIGRDLHRCVQKLFRKLVQTSVSELRDTVQYLVEQDPENSTELGVELRA